MIKGISRGSRPILRHQPQLRLDCSPAMWPFSKRATGCPSGEEQALRKADDPAADDDDVGAGRQGVVGVDRIDARRHLITLRPASVSPACGPEARGSRPPHAPKHHQSIAACTRLATRSSRSECHGSAGTKLVM